MTYGLRYYSYGVMEWGQEYWENLANCERTLHVQQWPVSNFMTCTVDHGFQFRKSEILILLGVLSDEGTYGS